MENNIFVPTANELIMDNKWQERWISHPESRIVINPFNYDDASLWGQPQAVYCNRPTLPLNIGYLDPWVKDSRGSELKDAVMILENSHNMKGKLIENWNINNEDSGSYILSDGIVFNKLMNGFTIHGDKESGQEEYKMDFHCKPSGEGKLALVFHISEIKGRWSLKIFDDKCEHILQRETTSIGAYSFLEDQWDRSVSNELHIVLSLHGADASAHIDDMRVLQGSFINTAAEDYSTTWQPHKSGFKGRFADGLSVEGYDFLYNTKTIVRRIKWTGKSNPIIIGEYLGRITCDDKSLNVSRSNYHYAVAVNTSMGNIRFYKSLFELMADSEPALEPYDSYGFYRLELPLISSDNEITVAFTIDTNLVTINDISSMAITAAEDKMIEDKLDEMRRFWDDFLGKIPYPANFEFKYIDSKGVSFEDISLMYYVGWVLLEASIIPANLEAGFNYRQLTAGKPSLWGYGDSRAAYTAAWDSLYGIQLLAFADAPAAWETFTGIMSLVDQDGMLAGESLPLMRARTAWILYNCLPDKQMLHRNFQNLEKNILWGLEHPYWIWMGNNPLDSTMKDVDFTAAALVDIPYFIEICHELDKKEKAVFWEKKYEDFFGKYLVWTFPKDETLPSQYYTSLQDEDDGSGARDKGIIIYTVKSLHVQKLKKSYIECLMRLFHTEYDAGKSFCGFTGVKLEEIQYTIYGLMENGYIDEARKMIESSIRDVTRSRFIGENYTNDDHPVCWGVRPSLFGIVQLADCIWLRNGFRYDLGGFVGHNIFGSSGSIRNVYMKCSMKDYIGS